MADVATHLGFEHVFEPGEDGWTLLALHGTGGSEHDLLALGRRLAPGAALLSPRGKVLEDGVSLRFFRRLAVGKLDIPDLLARTDELAEFVGAASGAYGFDPARVVAVGFSNGANIAASLLLRRPEVLRGAALLRAMLPYEPEHTPALDGTDVLVAAGERDPYSPLDQTQRLVDILRAAGARVEAQVQPGAGHGLTREDLEGAQHWMSTLIAPA